MRIGVPAAEGRSRRSLFGRCAAVMALGLSLGACAMPGWAEIEFPKSAPPIKPSQIVSFESEPWGATAALSTGQSCRSPCSLWVAEDPFTVEFSLPGYTPALVPVRMATAVSNVSPGEEGEQPSSPASRPLLAPNPVVVALSPTPPPQPVVVKKKKPVPPPRRHERVSARHPT